MSDSLIAGTNPTDTGAQQGAATESAAAALTTPAEEGAAVQQQAGAQAAAATGEKPAGETGAEGATKTDGDEGKPQGAPEKYEFKAPEGGNLDPAVMAEFEGVARELDLPQEAAQKLIDKIGPKIAAAQMENFQKVQTEWADTSKSDKEFGGDKLAENLAVAKKALDAFGTPELRTLLNETGLGNHPELIRAFYRAGKQISEDKFVPAGAGKGPVGGKDLASRLYPNQPNN